MPIEVTTVYDRQRILRFNWVYAKTKAYVWWVLGIVTAYVFCLYLYLRHLGASDSNLGGYLLILLAMDATYLFCRLVLPYFTVQKSKSLNSTIHFTFSEESAQMHAVAQQMESTSTIRYEALYRVIKQGDTLYLFLTRTSAGIVDLSNLSPEQTETLRTLLKGAVKPRRFKWK